jgi:large subunit ribosomal protein L17
MRHGKKFNHLGRKAGHRKALLQNLSIALIEHKRIETTLAKAKALRRHIEPIVTKAKNNTTHSRRVAFSYLQNKEAIKELFGTVAPAVGDRPGGYTRVIRMGFRKGDGAEMALIEFVDFNPDYSGKASPEGAGKKKRRRRRGGKSGGAAATAGAVTAAAATKEAAEAVEEATSEEE